MTDDDAVKLARTVVGDLFGDTIDRSTMQDLARAVLSQHEELGRLREQVANWKRGQEESVRDHKDTCVKVHALVDETDRLREALREALERFSRCLGQLDTVNVLHWSNAEIRFSHERIAAIEKEFGL